MGRNQHHDPEYLISPSASLIRHRSGTSIHGDIVSSSTNIPDSNIQEQM